VPLPKQTSGVVETGKTIPKGPLMSGPAITNGKLLEL